MNDLISRQAAINVADSSDYVGLSVEDVKKVTDEVVKGLKRLPSAQQDIIRCKDCGHADWSGLPEGMLYCMVHEHYLSEDDYCSYGVKEDG